MAGYIGARSVSLSTTVANAQDVTATDTTPEVTIINNTHEDTDGGREGKVIFKGQQSGGEESTLAEIEANHSGSSDDELGQLVFKTNDGSDGTSPTERLRINNTEVVFNDNSNDLDFRIESDDNANMFVVNAADDVVGIGRTPTSSEGSVLQLEGGDGLALRRPGQTNSFLLRPIGSGDGMRFTQGGTGDLMTLLSDGTLLVGKTASSNAVEGTGIEKNGAISNVITSTGGASQNMLLNRHSADGKIIQFRQANNNEGDISVSGSTVSYNGFSGLHESSGIPTNTPVGTVVSTIDELDVYPQKQIEDGEEVDSPKAGQTRKDHPKVKVSDTEGDACVYGVVGSFTEQDKVNVVSVGIGSVRVTGACSKGDLLESNGDGTAKVQSDDIIKSKTIGKVTIGNSNTDVKLVSCVMYCG